MNKAVISIIITIVFLLTGCIKEDLSNCPDDFTHTVYFIYNGDGDTDIFDSKIKSVDLYVFDEDGVYVNNYTYNQNQLETYQGANLKLTEGNYTVVSWGNVTGLSEITDENERFSSYRLFSAPYLQEETITNFDSLYYNKQVITVSGRDNSTDTLFFQSAHINMEIYVEGLETTINSRAIGDPNGWIVVRNVYAGYDFNKRVTGDITDMYPDWVYDPVEDRALSRFHLFRFNNDNSIVIDIYNRQGVNVYALQLKDFLAENNINVESVNEITLPITIRFRGTNVSVSITEWGSEIVRPIL